MTIVGGWVVASSEDCAFNGLVEPGFIEWAMTREKMGAVLGFG